MSEEELDPAIHVPARLRIMVTLASLPDGDDLSFTRLQDLIGLTPGNLITHLRKLEDTGYITTHKNGGGVTGRTSVPRRPVSIGPLQRGAAGTARLGQSPGTRDAHLSTGIEPADAGPGRRSRTARLAGALRDRLVDALAVRAYRESRRVPAGHPLLPAQRDHRSAAHRTVHDLVLQDIVGEPLVIAITGGKVRPDIGVLAGSLLGKHFGTHGS